MGKILYISNSQFCHLNNEKRAHLKESHLNFINDGRSQVHYIQSDNYNDFTKKLRAIRKKYGEDIDLLIYTKDQLGKAMGLFSSSNENPYSSVSLF